MDLTSLREKAGQWIKKYKFVILILILGIALMLMSGTAGKKEETPVTSQPEAQQESLDEQLSEILSNIQGAGRVQVMLTTKAGAQTVYQTDQPSTDRQDTVIITDDNRAQSGLVQQVISPTYRGAIVLCQAADSATVCLAIKDAVSKVTGLDTSEISVLKMK